MGENIQNLSEKLKGNLSKLQPEGGDKAPRLKGPDEGATKMPGTVAQTQADQIKGMLAEMGIRTDGILV